MRLTCPNCGKLVESEVELTVGRRVQCPYCKGKFAYGTTPKDAAKANPPAKPPPKCPAKPHPAQPPRLFDEDGDIAGGGSGSFAKVAFWAILILAAALCLPKLRTSVMRYVAPETAAREGFEPVAVDGESVPRGQSERRSGGRGGRPEEYRPTAEEAPDPRGAKLAFCDDPKALGAGAFVKRFSDGGALYVVDGTAHFARADTNATWSVPEAGAAFDPAAQVLGEARQAVGDLALDVSAARFRVKVGVADVHRPNGDVRASVVRDRTWETVGDVPYGETLDRAAFEKAAGEAVKQGAKRRAIATFPLDAKLRVSVQVYEGRQVVFNEATHKWLLPRYRANADDKAAWDRINGRLDGEQRRFKAHRREIRAKRRAWYANNIRGEALYKALRSAVVAVEPHVGAPAPAASEEAPLPVVEDAPVAEAAPPAEEAPVETAPEAAKPDGQKPVEAKPVEAVEDEDDLEEYDDDF